MARLIRLGDAASQFFNVLLFNGDPNYSISGDAYRFKRAIMVKIIDWLFSRWEQDHCKTAYENDVLKAAKLLEESQAIA